MLSKRMYYSYTILMIDLINIKGLVKPLIF